MSALDPAAAEEPLYAAPIAAPVRLIEDKTLHANEGEIGVTGYSEFSRDSAADMNALRGGSAHCQPHFLGEKK